MSTCVQCRTGGLGEAWRCAGDVERVTRGAAGEFRMKDMHRRREGRRNTKDKRGRQRERGHRGDGAAHGAISMAFMRMTAGRGVIVTSMHRRRNGGTGRRKHFGVLLRGMMGVGVYRIGRDRAFRGGFKDVEAKLSLRGGVGDQCDRNKPRGKT